MPEPGAWRPRLHHYMFAHRLLPELVSRNPVLIVSGLASPQGQELLQCLWDSAAELVRPDEHLSGDRLTAKYRNLGEGCHGVVVSMPEAQRTTEVHYVGILTWLCETWTPCPCFSGCTRRPTS